MSFKYFSRANSTSKSTFTRVISNWIFTMDILELHIPGEHFLILGRGAQQGVGQLVHRRLRCEGHVAWVVLRQQIEQSRVFLWKIEQQEQDFDSVLHFFLHNRDQTVKKVVNHSSLQALPFKPKSDDFLFLLMEENHMGVDLAHQRAGQVEKSWDMRQGDIRVNRPVHVQAIGHPGHDLALRVLAQQFGGAVDQRDPTGGGRGTPNQHVRGGDVIQEQGPLMGVITGDGDIEDEPRVVVGFLN